MKNITTAVVYVCYNIFMFYTKTVEQKLHNSLLHISLYNNYYELRANKKGIQLISLSK